MSKVGKTPKLVVVMPKVTTPQGSTLGSNSTLAQSALKEEKGKAIKLRPSKGKDDNRDTLIRGIPKF